MAKYFFNVVLDGVPTVDRSGRELPEDEAAREHARHTAMLLSALPRDPTTSFIAVSDDDGLLLFKVPFPEPRMQGPQ